MFTLIAYRSNGYCPSGSQVNSDFEISYHESAESLGVEFLKFKKVEFEHRDYREFNDYDFTILHNGRDIYDVSTEWYQEMFDELNAVAYANRAEWRKEEDQARAEASLANMRNQRDNDLAELARLQQRLGITG